jgi:predicted nucleic acid-binding protein
MTYWLADKSALTRIPQSPDGAQWQERIERGLVRIATATRLEIGFSVRSGAEVRLVQRGRPLAMMPVEYLTPAVEDRAVEVQALLADRGQHRAPSVPDLLLAAAAELGVLTVLHVDKDFEIIADVTGQPVERLRLPADQ